MFYKYLSYECYCDSHAKHRRSQDLKVGASWPAPSAVTRASNGGLRHSAAEPSKGSRSRAPVGGTEAEIIFIIVENLHF